MRAAPSFARQLHDQRTMRFSALKPSPVHSAHVGQELAVHYRWHPYFRYKVIVRRVERRADGLFYLVMGPTGSVISIAGWMLDPAICAGMTFGFPNGRGRGFQRPVRGHLEDDRGTSPAADRINGGARLAVLGLIQNNGKGVSR